MSMLARLAFAVLERARKSIDYCLMEMTIEFGLTKQGNILLRRIVHDCSKTEAIEQLFRSLISQNGPLQSISTPL